VWLHDDGLVERDARELSDNIADYIHSKKCPRSSGIAGDGSETLDTAEEPDTSASFGLIRLRTIDIATLIWTTIRCFRLGGRGSVCAVF